MAKLGPEQFSKRMTIIADGIGKNVNQVIRRAALSGDQVAVIRTPVDTGRARANWFVSVGAPEVQNIEGPNLGDKGANEGAATATALGQAQAALARYDIKLGPIFITNSVPYIGFLDEGASQQAPDGITPFVLQAIRAQLKRARILRGI